MLFKNHFWIGAMYGALLAGPTSQIPTPIFAATTIAQSTRAESRSFPSIAELSEGAGPEDFATLKELISKPADTQDAQLIQLNRALEIAKAPNRVRGMIQMMRSGVLFDLDRDSESQLAIQESMRLLPEYSGPVFQAATVYSYSDKPKLGAQYLIRAVVMDPGLAAQFPDREISNLLERLSSAGETNMADRLSERLLAINWSGTTLGAGSKIVMRGIKMNMAKQQVDAARDLIPRLVVPKDSIDLLIDRQYEPLWPTIDQWGGPKLQRQWKIYLNEARNRYNADKDGEALVELAIALASARQSDELIELALPLFSADAIRKDNWNLLYVIAFLTKALVDKGRIAEAEVIYQRAADIWPVREDANFLNVHANYAKFLLLTDRPKEALAKMDDSLEAAKKFGSVVNLSALSAMQHYRTCALFKVGRKQEAMVEAKIAQASHSPSAVTTFLCTGQYDEARKLLTDNLQSDERRSQALNFVQPKHDEESPTKFGKEMNDLADRLSSDPKVLQIVAKVGRILPYAAADGAATQP